MTIRIEPLTNQLDTTNENTPSLSIFLKTGFRHALASELRLEAINLYFDVKNQTLMVPAYRKFSGKQQTIIIGAGFDKTGDMQLPTGISFADCINTLMAQLKNQKSAAVSHLEIRSKHFIPTLKDHSDKVELSIQPDVPVSDWLMKFSESTRRNIRMPFKHGLRFEIGTEKHHLDAFYTLYLKQIHQLGSLPHSYSFFQALWEKCRDDINLFIGYMDNQPVIAGFQFLSAHEVYGAWSGADSDYKKYNVFLAMLWSILEFSEQTGRRCYNLGRTSLNSGAYHFKKRLATHEQRIYYYKIDVKTGQSVIPHPTHNYHRLARHSASWLIRRSPPQLMHALSQRLIHRFY